MPTFRGQISEEEIYALIAYFRSLQRGQTPPRVEDYPPPTGDSPNQHQTLESGASDARQRPNSPMEPL